MPTSVVTGFHVRDNISVVIDHFRKDSSCFQFSRVKISIGEHQVDIFSTGDPHKFVQDFAEKVTKAMQDYTETNADLLMEIPDEVA